MTSSLPEKFEGPGLLNLQLNGYAGIDFNTAPDRWSSGGLLRVRAALGQRGVLGALPTLITADPDAMVGRAQQYAKIVDGDPRLAKCFPRLHIEGPFLSPEDGPRGAHPRRFCRTPRELPELLARLREASGDRIGILTLAPELPGALELIEEASAAGIVVGLGHTQASAEVLAEAVAAGARMSTHLGNGTHQTLPRHANYVQLQLAEDALAASFIADGHHLPWYTLQNFLRAKGAARSILVTDAIAGADAPPGRYPLGEAEVEVTPDRRVQIPGQANLAGSALTLDRAVLSVARHCGVPFEQAWAMASILPAALLGMDPLPRVAVAVTDSGFSADFPDDLYRTS